MTGPFSTNFKNRWAPRRRCTCPTLPAVIFIRPDGLLRRIRSVGGRYVRLLLCRFVASRLGPVRDLRFCPGDDLTFAYGQTGFLISALFVGGFRLAESRPMLSGIIIWTGFDQAAARGIDRNRPDLGAALANPGRRRCDRSGAYLGQHHGIRIVDFAGVAHAGAGTRGLGCNGETAIYADQLSAV